jgi:hypothetical protein
VYPHSLGFNRGRILWFGAEDVRSLPVFLITDRFAARISGLAFGLALAVGLGSSTCHVTALTSVTITSPSLNAGVPS